MPIRFKNGLNLNNDAHIYYGQRISTKQIRKKKQRQF